MAKDPASGSMYFYNENTGKSQWERPIEYTTCPQSPIISSLPQDWEEAFDDSTGMEMCLKIPAISYKMENVMVKRTYSIESLNFCGCMYMVKDHSRGWLHRQLDMGNCVFLQLS